MPRRKTKEQFINEAKRIHGDKYDYSNAIYNGTNSRINILCPEHGEFTTIAKRHTHNTQGCPVCGIGAINYKNKTIRSRKTHEQFLSDAKRIHGDKYDYSLCTYTGGKHKLPIICNKHGIFYAHPENHINSSTGCRKCYIESRKNKQGISGYSLKYFNTYPEKKNIDAIVYVAQMQNKNDNFIKIGITTKSNVKERFYFKAKHGTKIISLIEKPYTLYDAYITESYLLSILSEYRYFPNRKFEGYTECIKINKTTLEFLENYFGINITNNVMP